MLDPQLVRYSWITGMPEGQRNSGVEAKERGGEGYEICGAGKVSVRGTGGAVLEAGELEVVR
jgi:hypothetical protein